MSSVVFVSTNPLFVAAASVLLFHERLGSHRGGHRGGDRRRGDRAESRTSLNPDAISTGATAGAPRGRLRHPRTFSSAARLRTRMSLSLYVGIVYVVAAAGLLCAAALYRHGLSSSRSRRGRCGCCSLLSGRSCSAIRRTTRP